jgi:hypothetical protein
LERIFRIHCVNKKCFSEPFISFKVCEEEEEEKRQLSVLYSGDSDEEPWMKTRSDEGLMCHTDAETVKVFQKFEQIEMGHCIRNSDADNNNPKSDIVFYKLR